MSSIADLEKGSSLLGLVSNRLKVRTNSGMEFVFVLSRRDEVAELIQQQRSRSSPPGA